MNYKYSFHVISFAFLLFMHMQSFASDMVSAGWIEKAVLYPDGVILHAKLDTGAETTSINAINPEFFDRDNSRWARFNITNRYNESVTIEARVIREAKIKRHFGEKQVRPVILLDICIGDVRKREEVNLVDRSNLKYQLLIGRNFLKGDILVDSGSTYIVSPDCSD